MAKWNESDGAKFMIWTLIVCSPTAGQISRVNLKFRVWCKLEYLLKLKDLGKLGNSDPHFFSHLEAMNFRSSGKILIIWIEYLDHEKRLMGFVKRGLISQWPPLIWNITIILFIESRINMKESKVFRRAFGKQSLGNYRSKSVGVLHPGLFVQDSK